ncbi:CHIA.2 family protein [Megaselia abdita]
MNNLLAAFLGILTLVDGAIIYCYFGSWAGYRNGDGKFQVSNIDPFLCTHIGYAFFGITPNGSIQSLDLYLDFTLGAVPNLNLLKSTNPELKTLAAIGGWNQGSNLYSTVAASPSLRQNFITSVIDFIQRHGFDGIDLDWEYPGQRDSSNPSLDKQNFVIWLQEIQAAFESYGFILKVACSATQSSASISYDIPEISKYVDMIGIMTYDLHGSWDGVTGMNAPLYSNDGLNVDAGINYWLQQGAPASKLLMGVAFYGRTFTLANSANNGIGAASNGPGSPGPYTQESGFLGYNEICSSSWNNVWSDDQKVPYAYQGNQWVGYDDVQSLQLKMDYMISKGLAGVMIWSIETDDFLGRCGSVNPLLKVLNGGSVITTPAVITTPSGPPTTTPSPVITTGPPTTTPSPVTTTTPLIITTRPPTTTPSPVTSTTPLIITTRPPITTPSPVITTRPPTTTPSPITTRPPTTTPSPITTKPPITSQPSNNTSIPTGYKRIDCEALGDGFYRDVDDWALFYKCDDGQQFYFVCQEGMLFDNVNNICDYYYIVDPSLPITTKKYEITTTNTPRSIPFVDIGCANLPEGFYRDEEDCSIYRVCTEGQQFDFYCQEGMLFDTKKNVCNFNYIVDCS